jgi:hypothetical protein
MQCDIQCSYVGESERYYHLGQDAVKSVSLAFQRNVLIPSSGQICLD